MFGKMINNYYYGKSGKGDFRKEDLPKNRWQLFWEMLRVRLSALCRMNLMTLIAFLPTIILLGNTILTLINGVSLQSELAAVVQDAGVVMTEDVTQEAYNELATQALLAAERTEEEVNYFLNFNLREFFQALLWRACIYLIPCIAITGPVQAGMSYVTRNWARDEHAFVWADFKDAVKDNWKQALAVSVITSFLPAVLYMCWNFYGNMASERGAFFMVPQMLVALLALLWVLGLTYMYPMMVSYKTKLSVIIKNSLLMGVARLPQTVGARLATALPCIVCALLLFATGAGMYALLALALYYALIGYALSRFVFASVSNAAFDKFINSHMEGVPVNRGLSLEDEEDEDEDGEKTAQEQDGAPRA